MPRSPRRLWVTGALILVVATVGFLAFPPWSVPGLSFVFLVPLFLLGDRLERHTGRLILGTVAAASLGYAGGYPWIAVVVHEFGGVPWVVAVPLLLLFCALGSASVVVLMLYRRMLMRRYPPALRVLLLAAGGVALETFFPRLFPWFAGLSLDWCLPLLQPGELGGLAATGLLVYLANGALYEAGHALLTGKQRGAALAVAGGVALLVAVAWLWGEARIRELETLSEESRSVRVGLLQGNISNRRKTETEGGDPRQASDVTGTYAKLAQQAVAAGAELVVWPETAYPYFINRDPERETAEWSFNRKCLESYQRAAGVPMIVGGLEAEGGVQDGASERNSNVAFAVVPGQPLQSYRKNVLIPFGEMIPEPLNTWFPSLAQRMPRSFLFTASETADVLEIDGVRYAGAICYEATLDRFVRDNVVEGQAQVLVNLTNDSWFGRTGEPVQHLAMSRLRSIELRVPLVRATNTGISAVVAPSGRILAQTPLFETTSLVERVAVLPEVSGQTLFARHPRGLAWTCLLVALAAVAGGWRRRTSTP